MAKKQENKTRTPRILNKKASHDYEFIEKVEAGLVLTGSEVKSLREGRADMSGAYARILGDQCYLVGCKIEQYKQASYNNHEPERKRKLLLHKRQIKKITIKLEQRGFTLVPTKIYFNDRGYAKIELVIARGKKHYDKRSSIQQRDQKRDLERTMKSYGR